MKPYEIFFRSKEIRHGNKKSFFNNVPVPHKCGGTR
jgi:hypothetical protein